MIVPKDCTAWTPRRGKGPPWRSCRIPDLSGSLTWTSSTPSSTCRGWRWRRACRRSTPRSSVQIPAWRLQSWFCIFCLEQLRRCFKQILEYHYYATTKWSYLIGFCKSHDYFNQSCWPRLYLTLGHGDRTRSSDIQSYRFFKIDHWRVEALV